MVRSDGDSEHWIGWFQWGHGIAAVDGLLDYAEDRVLIVLQWGHGIAAVDGDLGAGVPP